MTVQTLKVAGKRFVLVPEKAFRDLERRAKSALTKPNARQKRRRLTAAMREKLEDGADVRAARAALREKGAIPWEQVKAELGLRGLGHSSGKASNGLRRKATA
jgi:hypothetical protein